MSDAAKPKILIVDDEEDIIDFLTYNLEKEGYEVESAVNGQLALNKIPTFNPELVILDIMMPVLDGIQCCRQIREKKKWDNIKIAFLTAKNEDMAQIEALDKGADDFIAKPIKVKVLLSRIKAILRRKGGMEVYNEKEIIQIADLIIDPVQMLVIRQDEKMELAKKEFLLLYLLASKPGKVFKRTEILNKIWGTDIIVGDRTIDVHIRKIRERLGDHYIKTVKGIGYKIEF